MSMKMNRTMTENNLCIALNQVGKTVDTPEGKLDILDNISLEVEYQEAVVIKGASGSGKTTLLGLMAGLDQASSGDIKLLGHDLMHKSEEQRAAIRAGQVGFVFQSFHLVARLSAFENVELPMVLAGMPPAGLLGRAWKDKSSKMLRAMGEDTAGASKATRASGWFASCRSGDLVGMEEVLDDPDAAIGVDHADGGDV